MDLESLFTNIPLNETINNCVKDKNKYIKWPSRENFLSLKRVKSKCNSINKKTERQYFKNATKGDIINKTLI